MHHSNLSCWLSAGLLLACTGCTSNPPAAPQAVSAEQGLAALLVKANGAESSGQKEQAVNLWKQATTAYPAAKEPWGKLAQFQYDGGQYADAAQSAQQALARDAKDEDALLLLTRASLRLAARSAHQLARQKGVSAALRNESLESIRQLREAMGDSAALAQAGHPARSSAVAPRPPEPRKPPRSDDPFSKLKDSLR